MNPKLFGYLLVMAGVTYLIRMLPMVLMKKEIENRFFEKLSFYVPYAVLGAMTFPAIAFCTDYLVSALIGCVTALVLAYFKKSLFVVASCACVSVFAAELIIKAILKQPLL